MNYYRTLVLAFFSVMICFMAVVKPLVNSPKKNNLTEQQEQQETSCPESSDEEGCKETAKENIEENAEWNDEFWTPSVVGFSISLPSKASSSFLYLVHFSEHVAAISLPPPEFFPSV
ncbi:Na+-transporting methylmalonyl-CoA/oxaloacetate decarboxylase gamma subunit [Runella defluvii]|uniref:Na+-transporting methylmalonyl-CoA/oxaloacetate decarboxylase gamma subunit n=1 Tax=Runella defluvii TaxID=370973 RepID=A0A7W5ZHU7_9BACT|nr:hypothetical protein [Runella defluvii]MBB3837143.1 Na+-transporting methylmalonyl-CoA/oxaloacetate decarboxylase gamma subunit [Runella defluvii]